MLDRFREHGRFLIEEGEIRLKIDDDLPVGWGVYAFRQGGEWKYVGCAKETRRRMQSYLRHQRRASQSRAVHVALREALAVGPVAVFAIAFDEPIVDHDGLPMHQPLGVEAGLITRLNPTWNRRGLSKAAGVEFIAENGGGAGVRLRKPGSPHDEGKQP